MNLISLFDKDGKSLGQCGDSARGKRSYIVKLEENEKWVGIVSVFHDKQRFYNGVRFIIAKN